MQSRTLELLGIHTASIVQAADETLLCANAVVPGLLTPGIDLPPLNGTTSRERIWGWCKPREATNATRKEGTG